MVKDSTVSKDFFSPNASTGRRRDRQINAELLERLNTAGCPVDPPDETWSPSALGGRLKIFQSGGVNESSLHEVGMGIFACNISLRIATDLHCDLLIDSWELVLPWSDPGFQWLEDPTQFDSRREEYLVPCTQLYFPRIVVLNHRKWFRKNDVAEGLLLGTCGIEVPSEYPHGSTVEGKLSAQDQFGEPITSVLISLWVDRSLSLDRSRASRVVKSRRKSLFEVKDTKSPPERFEQPALRDSVEFCGAANSESDKQ
jgi:hypothetical protein